MLGGGGGVGIMAMFANSHMLQKHISERAVNRKMEACVEYHT